MFSLYNDHDLPRFWLDEHISIVSFQRINQVKGLSVCIFRSVGVRTLQEFRTPQQSCAPSCMGNGNINHMSQCSEIWRRTKCLLICANVQSWIYPVSRWHKVGPFHNYSHCWLTIVDWLGCLHTTLLRYATNILIKNIYAPILSEYVMMSPPLTGRTHYEMVMSTKIFGIVCQHSWNVQKNRRWCWFSWNWSTICGTHHCCVSIWGKPDTWLQWSLLKEH